MKGNVERRHYAHVSGLDVRSSGRRPIISGYAARFNSLSGDLGGFREIIRPGAFRSAIATSDIRALWNHDANMVLGRTKAGTLRVEETDGGLYVEIDPPDTAAGRDALEMIRRGDVTQMSFAFKLAPGGDTWSKASDGTARREITRFAEVFDVSPVTYPAYADTEVSVRSLLEARGLNPDDYVKPKRKGKPVSYFQKRLYLASL